MLRLAPYSLGVGDRFAHQASAQLRGFQRLLAQGIEVVPVWNKSQREHTFIGSEPRHVRVAAAAAVQAANWPLPWHVDADHIRLDTVERFLECSDFFTIDVADAIGLPESDQAIDHFVERHAELRSPLSISGLEEPLRLTVEEIRSTVRHYGVAARRAGEVFHHIARSKGGVDRFIAEVSMDETEQPQSPTQLLVILILLAEAGVELQTIAPKFSGRFNKGVDYVGDLAQFEREFLADVAVTQWAAREYGLPDNLKLSVHSGSDKFSLYPILRRVIRARSAGLHLKTAGTTWLEELSGLAAAGGDGLQLAQEIYRKAYEHCDELTQPYATVIDIQKSKLPSPETVERWSGEQFVRALEHDPLDPQFNADLRQLLHVSFKLAAKAGQRYTDLLEKNADVVGRYVDENIYQRHLLPLFGPDTDSAART